MPVMDWREGNTMPSLADNLVSQIFELRGDREPDADPGDLTIIVQDDMPLAEVAQRGQTIGRGANVLSALGDAVDNVAKGQGYGLLAGMVRLRTLTEESDHREALRGGAMDNEVHGAAVLSGEVVVMRASDLYELLGEVALPPYPCGCGRDVDCAPLAEWLRERVEALQL